MFFCLICVFTYSISLSWILWNFFNTDKLFVFSVNKTQARPQHREVKTFTLPALVLKGSSVCTAIEMYMEGLLSSNLPQFTVCSQTACQQRVRCFKNHRGAFAFEKQTFVPKLPLRNVLRHSEVYTQARQSRQSLNTVSVFDQFSSGVHFLRFIYVVLVLFFFLCMCVFVRLLSEVEMFTGSWHFFLFIFKMLCKTDVWRNLSSLSSVCSKAIRPCTCQMKRC